MIGSFFMSVSMKKHKSINLLDAIVMVWYI